jgi:hypothetical protein
MLILSIVIFYFLYQLIFISSAVTGRVGSCIYEFWTPHQEWWRNPYWLVVAIVSGLLLLSTVLAIEGIARKDWTKVASGSLACVVLTLWLYGLSGLWNAMQFEKGEIPAEVWYENERGAFGMALLEKEHVCKPAT